MREAERIRDPHDRAGDRLKEEVEPALIDEVLPVHARAGVEEGVGLVDDEELSFGINRTGHKLEDEPAIGAPLLGKRNL